MSKTWVVLKTEFINTITRRSFILTLVLLPLIPALILGALSLFGEKETIDGIETVTIQPKPEDQAPQGYVDLAKIISSAPVWLEDAKLINFVKESDAQQALVVGDIDGFFVIEADYLQSGAVSYTSRDITPIKSFDSTWMIDTLIQFNLLGGDLDRFEVFQNPIFVHHIDITPENMAEGVNIANNPVGFYVPYGMTMLFYILIITSASLMMNSVAKEKENRLMEVLMSSIEPTQLLTGKILGLGLVGLLQLIVWLGSALILLRLGGKVFAIPPEVQLPPNILIWGVIFFILGYLVYATLMAGVGALVGSVKEASQATFFIIIPILIPLMLIGVIVANPNAILPTVLSLIPFTAPNTIMTRMAINPIPPWQLLLSIVLLLLTIFLLMRAVAGMFRAQYLLTGKKFTLKLFFKALSGKGSEEIEVVN